jgi:hypothetical protein
MVGQKSHTQEYVSIVQEDFLIGRDRRDHWGAQPLAYRQSGSLKEVVGRQPALFVKARRTSVSSGTVPSPLAFQQTSAFFSFLPPLF